MEILIPGLILVALMVYASTRIKRTAAAAFEAETVETDEFIIQKPDGFLNVIGPDPKYIFEGYSKDFGTDSPRVRMATANVIVDDRSIDDVVADIDGEITSDISEVIGEGHYRVIEASRTENEIHFRTYNKLAEKNGKTYRMEMVVLGEASEEFVHRAEAMLTSFELK